MIKKGVIDVSLLLVVLLLLASGIIMVFSASWVSADYLHNNSYYFLGRQAVWAVIGIIAMLFMANYDYHKLSKLSIPLMIITIILLMMVFVPGIGIERNGGKRWIGIGIGQFQPSEIAKLVIVIYLSSSLSKKKDILRDFFNGLLPYLLVIAVIAGLIIIEPHLSSAVIVFFVGAVILFSAGAKILHFTGLGLAGIMAAVGAIIAEPYRLDRIKAFLDPWAYSSKEGYQITQSLMAIGSGALWGVGLGLSRQKRLYIPEPHNDFVFSIIGEELGFFGCTLVLLLFLIFIWKGIKIAVNAPDMLGSLLSVGITSLIAIQAIINVAVVTSSMPVTGQPLPFFSAGGTSLVFLLIGVGIILNISRYSNYNRG